MTRGKALWLRGMIERAAQSLPEDISAAAATLYPRWAENTGYAAGYKIQSGGYLYRCVQSHTSQIGWEPENAASLWMRIDETHSGTAEDPIPYSGNMALTAGLYYIQDGVTFLCVRDTGNPVYASLAELLGIYVEIAP